MKKLFKRNNWQWVAISMVGLLITFSYFTMFGQEGLFRYWHLSEQKSKLDKNNFHLQQENETLRERIYHLRYDDRYLEKLAREKLGLVRQGDIVYRFTSLESDG